MTSARQLRQCNRIRQALPPKEARFIQLCALLAGRHYDTAVLCTVSLHRIAIIHAREFYLLPGTRDLWERRKR